MSMASVDIFGLVDLNKPIKTLVFLNTNHIEIGY